MPTTNLTPEQKEFRKEVSRLNSMANKRIRRLENSNLAESPAYNKWKESGGEMFSIRGKTQQEVRREYYRVKHYLDSKTSSITGTKEVLQNMAENVGLEYSSVFELQESSKAFFELANKVDDYLSVSSRGSEAIGYQRIWQAINQYTQDTNIKVKSQSVDGLIEVIADLSEKLLDKDNIDSSSFFDIDWTKLE